MSNMKKARIYLDFAAATPLDPEVQKAMLPYMSENFYNPSGLYLSAKKVAKDIGAAREEIAHWLGARPVEVVFTAGGTEANNLAIHGVMQQFPGAHMLVSAVEHEAALQPASQYDHTLIPVNQKGVVDPETVKQLINKKTVLVSVMYANNEIGSIQPLRKIAHAIEEEREARKAHKNSLPIYLHTDACQAVNYLDIHASQLGVDLMTVNAGKIYGPKQCGALYVRAGTQLKPQIVGGGQERGFRSGTENTSAIIGFAKAMELSQLMRREEAKRLKTLQEHFFEALSRQLPSALINGSRTQRLPNNIHITLPGQDNERLLMELDERGVMCATGSACSAGSAEPSHVLAAMGMAEKDIHASLRITMGRSTTTDDMERLLHELTELAK